MEKEINRILLKTMIVSMVAGQNLVIDTKDQTEILREVAEDIDMDYKKMTESQ